MHIPPGHSKRSLSPAIRYRPDICLGNIEEKDIGLSRYDIIIALSTFEHEEHWQKGPDPAST